jgi:hypothetical protein
MLKAFRFLKDLSNVLSRDKFLSIAYVRLANCKAEKRSKKKLKIRNQAF